MILTRLKAMIVKEAWAILRDPRARLMLIMPPLLQLFLFAYASTMEVKNIRVAVFDGDGGAAAQELVQRIAGSPNVRDVVMVRSDAELRQSIDRQQAVAAIRIPERFSADVAAGRPATIGAIYDGRRSNAAQIVGGYIEQIAGGMGAEAMRGPPPGGSQVTHWFNPNLEYIWFVMPALVVIIAAVTSLGVVAQSIAREKELGTYDQLMVSPLRVHEILIGKIVPPVLVGLANVTLFVVLIPIVFGVPLTGSLPLFYLALLLYLLALTGIGMLISVIAQTQQQAFLGMFVVTVPLIVLSGYASPVDNMPAWLQLVAWVNPPTWFLRVSEGTFLKAMPPMDVLRNTAPLVPISLVTLGLASAMFRSRLE